jgi:2-oxoglutarate dehydrogenase E1 component
MRLPFRKPLVVVAPKKLLKFRGASSNIEEFSGQTRYLPLIPDKHPKLLAPEKVRKVILCSG